MSINTFLILSVIFFVCMWIEIYLYIPETYNYDENVTMKFLAIWSLKAHFDNLKALRPVCENCFVVKYSNVALTLSVLHYVTVKVASLGRDSSENWNVLGCFKVFRCMEHILFVFFDAAMYLEKVTVLCCGSVNRPIHLLIWLTGWMLHSIWNVQKNLFEIPARRIWKT